MWLVEVPLQVGKYHRGLITNAFSDSNAVYYALTMRSIWLWGSQLDLLPLVCQRTTCRSRDPTLGTCTWVGPLSSHGICLSMRDCLLQLIVNRLSRCLGQQKGGHMGSRRRAVIGLDLRLGPIPKEVWTGKIARLCNKAKTLSWEK